MNLHHMVDIVWMSTSHVWHLTLVRHAKSTFEQYLPRWLMSRTPTGRTFPGNFTLNLTKKWLFHAIFWHACLSSYGEFICSFNRLVVTDEEDAEYRSFECLMATQNVFNFQELCFVPSMQYGNLLSIIYIHCCHPKKHELENLLN